MTDAEVSKFKIDTNKYSKDTDENVCLTCLFWTGYRKRENSCVSTLSEGTKGVCLWHGNTSTQASFSCNHWIRKYKKLLE
ncbi:MAG: hypothetical protein N2Z58_07195 [Fervidobacterium sp.]|nr:hypothetical protein [Fervidobacterium sp.]